MEHLHLIPLDHEMAIRQQHDHLVLHARPTEYSKQIDAEHPQRRNPGQ
jgi:hypothetical protein